MTAAQLLLSAILLIMMLYAYTQRRRSALISYGVVLLALCGVFFVQFPDATNRIAEFVGIGRGADLVLYCFILFTLIAIFNLHLHLRSLSGANTELVRKIAILEALEQMTRRQ